MKTLFQSLLLLVITSAHAQEQVVNWTFDAQKLGEDKFEITFKASIKKGWYLYSQHLDPNKGPIPTSFNFEANSNLQLEGYAEETGNKKEGFDAIFEMNIVKFSEEAIFKQKVKISAPVTALSGWIEYMTCDEDKCLPPTSVDFNIPLNN